MITKITIRNFKKIETLAFDLGSPLVLIGPNNSGKTSILQAITLWETGIRKWSSKKDSKSKKNGKRQGVPINRKDLISLPVPFSKLLWHNLKTHIVRTDNGKRSTDYEFIDIVIDGNEDGKEWNAGLEFYYANDESFYCRPLRKNDNSDERTEIPEEAFKTRVAYLQPMSGLASTEDRLTPGSIDRKIGEGKTADVIRNISYQLLNPEREIDRVSDESTDERWAHIVEMLKEKFGIQINQPIYNPDNGLLEMTYKENGIEYDLSSAGRGFQQTLLLLCFLYSNPNKVILMDEPDAHLEVLRQKEIYDLICEVTRKLNSQLIIASHSEIVLNEAASREDEIVAVIENNAIILNDKNVIKKFKKALTDLGWDKYYLAKLKKHCIYLEGSTDLLNLKAFARLLNHPSAQLIEEANIDFVENNLPHEAFNRFNSIKLVEPGIKGLCVFDRLDRKKDSQDPITIVEWKKRELENYFCKPSVLKKWVEKQPKNLFTSNNLDVMEQCISDLTAPQYLKDEGNEWWNNEKISDWAEKIFREYFKRINEPMTMKKSNFHELIELLKENEIDPEITEKLDIIYETIKP